MDQWLDTQQRPLQQFGGLAAKGRWEVAGGHCGSKKVLLCFVLCVKMGQITACELAEGKSPAEKQRSGGEESTSAGGTLLRRRDQLVRGPRGRLLWMGHGSHRGCQGGRRLGVRGSPCSPRQRAVRTGSAGTVRRAGGERGRRGPKGRAGVAAYCSVLGGPPAALRAVRTDMELKSAGFNQTTQARSEAL